MIKYTIFVLVIENTSVRHEPTYHNGIKVTAWWAWLVLKRLQIKMLRPGRHGRLRPLVSLADKNNIDT